MRKPDILEANPDSVGKVALPEERKANILLGIDMGAGRLGRGRSTPVFHLSKAALALGGV